MTNLVRRRRKLKMTQRELARRVGTTQGVLSYYESRQRVPNFLLGIRILKALGLGGLKISVASKYFGRDKEETVAVEEREKGVSNEKSRETHPVGKSRATREKV